MLVSSRIKGGKERLVCLDDAGNSRVFQAAWTNYHDIGMPGLTTETTMRSSKSGFRFEDLEKLSKLLEDLKSV